MRSVPVREADRVSRGQRRRLHHAGLQNAGSALAVHATSLGEVRDHRHRADTAEQLLRHFHRPEQHLQHAGAVQPGDGEGVHGERVVDVGVLGKIRRTFLREVLLRPGVRRVSRGGLRLSAQHKDAVLAGYRLQHQAGHRHRRDVRLHVRLLHHEGARSQLRHVHVFGREPV